MIIQHRHREHPPICYKGYVKNEEEAKRKAYEAYTKHNDCFNTYNDDVAVWEIDNDPWISDIPDVLEVSEV